MRLVLLSLCVLCSACNGSGPSLPDLARDLAIERGRSEAGTDRGGADAGAGALCQLEWIDAHLHCDLTKLACAGTECACDATSWKEGLKLGGGHGGVILAIEHFAVDDRQPAELKLANEVAAETVKHEPSLLFAASLECWHSKKLDDAGWVAECKKDVDRWVGLGAIGFKDHIGKPYNHTGKVEGDNARWLGAWNRLNGFCTVPASSNQNQVCMEQAVSTLRYPAMEAKWREVLTYIVETKKLPVFSHASDWPGPEAKEQCYDPYLSKTVALCHQVTQSHLLKLAEWAKQTLSAEARRRLVIMHLGFLDMPNPKSLEQLLEAGLSIDTAARMDAFSSGGQQRRELITKFADQLLFGTDYKIADDCVKNGAYDAWLHAFSGKLDEKKTFTGCGTVEVTALGLAAPVSRKVLRDNFLRLIGRSCP